MAANVAEQEAGGRGEALVDGDVDGDVDVDGDGQLRIEREEALLEGDGEGLNLLDQLIFHVSRCVVVVRAPDDGKRAEEVQASAFLAACGLLVRIVNCFGLALSLARDDVASKTEVVRRFWTLSGKPAFLSEVVLADASRHGGLDDKAALKKLFAHARADPADCPTRMLLRLLWAFEFVAELFAQLGINGDQDGAISLHTAAATAYNATLAHRHPWTVRTGVKAALFALPRHRETVFEGLGFEVQDANMSDFEAHLRHAAAGMRRVAELLEKFYRERGLLDIP